MLARPGELYVLESETRMPKMPSGGKWFAKGQVVARAVDGETRRCTLSMSSELVFTDKVMIRKMLEAGFKKATKKSMKAWGAQIRELLAAGKEG